ncbi:3,4-dihydroxy-2-butanone-4-phosphate synthase [Ignatzschineria sp. LJL83]
MTTIFQEYGSIERVIQAIDFMKKGGMIIITDDASRENEGDLVMPAETITAKDTNFMIRQAGGLICAPISKEYADRLELKPMVVDNKDPYKTAFTVTIDLATTHTGISAFERTETLNALVDDSLSAKDFNRPGHIFPLIAKDGGVLERRGHTEASIDIVTLAGFKPAAVICEILKEDGEMARQNDLQTYAKEHQLPLISIQDIVNYRLMVEDKDVLMPLSNASLPTAFGEFQIYTFPNKNGGEPHIALVNKNHDSSKVATVRIHSECLTGDVFSSVKCDCHAQLEFGMKETAEAENGILLYLRQEGRGIGIVEKLKAYQLQEQGFDTIVANQMLGHGADERTYDEAAKMLKFFKAEKVQLLTNNPDKISAIETAGIEIERQGTPRFETSENESYLNIKRDQMGHDL